MLEGRGGACVLRVSSDRDERASQLKPFRASFFLPGGIRRGEGGDVCLVLEVFLYVFAYECMFFMLFWGP